MKKDAKRITIERPFADNRHESQREPILPVVVAWFAASAFFAVVGFLIGFLIGKGVFL